MKLHERGLQTAMEEALASLEAGMVQGAADTLREALAAHMGELRECCNAECEWRGETSRMCGAVGPLCPECGEVTELFIDPWDDDPSEDNLFQRLRDEADLCANEGAEDIARLLNEAADALK
jgi:hypothetical protein